MVADAAVKMNKWISIFFLDDGLIGQEIISIYVKDSASSTKLYSGCNNEFIVAIGNNAIREEIQIGLEEVGCEMAVVIHPLVSIGKGCILNTSRSADHDSKIDDFVHILPGVKLAGNASIGKRTWLGINSTVTNDMKVTSDCIIGAQSLVLNEIFEARVYIGSPVKGKSR